MSDRTDPPDRSSEELTHFARETSAGVVPPSFDSLVAVQRRRRRATLLGTAGATVAAVALVATTVQATYDDQSTPTPPATSTDSSAPSPSPTTDEPSPDAELTATQIVDGASSRLMSVTLAPGDPEGLTRVSVWMACAGLQECGRAAYALAVTSDGFSTRHLVPIEASQAPGVAPVDSDSFYVVVYDAQGNRKETMLESDGAERSIDFRPGDRRPLASGEVLISHGQRRLDYFALDPGVGVAHEIPVPEGNHPELSQSPNGLLYGVSDAIGESASRSIVWSDDGGGTWQSHRITTGREVSVSPMPSWEPGVMALSEGVLNTVIPLNRLHRSVDGGVTWEVIEQPFSETQYPDWSFVVPGGSLWVGVGSWQDDGADKPDAQARGVYASDAADWSALRRVSGLPATGRSEFLTGFRPSFGDWPAAVWIYDYSGSRAYVSGPDEDEWQETPAR
jgi:hypothetical protein